MGNWTELSAVSRISYLNYNLFDPLMSLLGLLFCLMMDFFVSTIPQLVVSEILLICAGCPTDTSLVIWNWLSYWESLEWWCSSWIYLSLLRLRFYYILWRFIMSLSLGFIFLNICLGKLNYGLYSTFGLSISVMNVPSVLIFIGLPCPTQLPLPCPRPLFPCPPLPKPPYFL